MKLTIVSNEKNDVLSIIVSPDTLFMAVNIVDVTLFPISNRVNKHLGLEIP